MQKEQEEIESKKAITPKEEIKRKKLLLKRKLNVKKGSR